MPAPDRIRACRPGVRRAARAALVAAMCGACSQSAGPPATGNTTCVQDADCGQVMACITAATCACVANRCLQSTPWPPNLSIEVAPLTSALPPAIELVAPKTMTTAPPVATFSIDGRASAAATFKYPMLTPAPMLANVTLAVRPSIPGRPDLPFDSLSESGGSVSWVLPAGTIGRPATLSIAPRPPYDQTSAPHSFGLTVGAAMAMDVAADPLVSITGRVLSAAGDVLATSLAARAYASGTPVSNVAPVSDGTFVLLASAATAQADDGLVVEVGPAGASTSDPTFVFLPRSFTGNSDLGTIKLPPYTPPQAFGITVVGDTSGGPPVGGALIRMRTTLPDADPQQAMIGSAELTVDAMTNDGGAATLALLPGVPTPRNYEVAIVPPAGSVYATACFAQSVGAGGATAPVALQPSKVLSRRAVFSGRVLDATGSVVPGVIISATPSSDPIPGCSRTAAAPATVLASDGRFTLPLDPGTYQIDYDPPPGTPAPRLTELAVTISGDIQRDVALPSGVVLDGLVTAPDGPLANATVRIFERRCVASDDCFGPNRTAPWLRAQLQTGGDGRFRAVVPAP